LRFRGGFGTSGAIVRSAAQDAASGWIACSGDILMTKLDLEVVREIVGRALAEDVGPGDVTSEALIPKDVQIRAIMVSRGDGVIAGLPVAREVFLQAGGGVEFREIVRDGERVEPGAKLAEVRGPARSVLAGERVALNFVQRMSGIATLTRRCVDAVAAHDCQILDTRKTMPCLRALEKYAVRMGGGKNHRMGLYDEVLIKDNHLHAVLGDAGDVNEAVRLAVKRVRHRVGNNLRVEVEAEDIGMVRAALGAGADIIMLDNMSLGEMTRACELVHAARAASGGQWPISEASGGLRPESLPEVAATGVDTISLGILTHSAEALDVALEIAERV